MEPLANHDYPFALGQEVETIEGQGTVLAQSRFGYPDGIYLVQFANDQRWMHPEEMAAITQQEKAA